MSTRAKRILQQLNLSPLPTPINPLNSDQLSAGNHSPVQ
jgi:hypothetical protein